MVSSALSLRAYSVSSELHVRDVYLPGQGIRIESLITSISQVL